MYRENPAPGVGFSRTKAVNMKKLLLRKWRCGLATASRKAKRPYLRNSPPDTSWRRYVGRSDDGVWKRRPFSGRQGRANRLSRAVSNQPAQRPERLCACEGAAGILWLARTCTPRLHRGIILCAWDCLHAALFPAKQLAICGGRHAALMAKAAIKSGWIVKPCV